MSDVRGIIVIFRDDNIGAIVHDVKCERMCYGDSSMAHTVAMHKILIALGKGETKVVV